MSSYEVTNQSKSPIVENLDTTDGDGKLETLSLGPKDKIVLTDAQFQSKNVQRHIQMRRFKAVQK